MAADPDDLTLLRAIAATVPHDADQIASAVLAHMPAFLVVVGLDGRCLWLSRNSPDADAVVGRSLFDFTDPASLDGMKAAFERVARTGQIDRYVGLGPGRRGPRSRYENVVAPIFVDRKVVALVQITRDVSEEWELYEALRDREQRLSLVLDAAGMGTWRFDVANRTVELDERARRIYGIDAPRLDSLTFTRTYIHVDDRAAADENALASLRGRRPYSTENRIVRADGQVRWVSITGSPIVESDVVIALMGTVTDVTDRHEREVRARQLQRLEAVGQLTAGVAHNFNNVLAAIVPTLSLVERRVDASLVPLVRGAEQAASRAADLIGELMTFSGDRAPKKTVEHPTTIVERALQLCRPTFDRGIELSVELARNLPAIHADAAQIEQALLNLLLNARDAVLECGRSAPRVSVRVSGAGQVVTISVEDNGPGVPEQLRDRVFDPFFTTKEVGRGTGLGLSTAYAIAREHGGALRYERAPRGGARFTLEIPASSAEVVPASAAPAMERASSGHILVVDDEPLVRSSIATALEINGLDVSTAGSGDEALTVLARTRGIALVLLDINMPGMPWRETLAAIRELAPAVRVLVFTGGVHQRDDSVDGWLAKPASPDELLGAITRTLATRADR
jgi:PAS domain S-box-containing protein